MNRWIIVAIWVLGMAGLVWLMVNRQPVPPRAPRVPKGTVMREILAGPPGSNLWFCDLNGDPRPPDFDFVWDEDAGGIEGSIPCAVTWQPGRWVRIDAGQP